MRLPAAHIFLNLHKRSDARVISAHKMYSFRSELVFPKKMVLKLKVTLTGVFLFIETSPDYETLKCQIHAINTTAKLIE